MRKLFFAAAIACALTACAGRQVEDKTPLMLETAIDSDLLILKTEDVRVAEARSKRISYEYKDANVRLVQLEDHARRFCEGQGRDVILVDMRLTKRDGFRRATFDCRDKPVLIPRNGL